MGFYGGVGYCCVGGGGVVEVEVGWCGWCGRWCIVVVVVVVIGS